MKITDQKSAVESARVYDAPSGPLRELAMGHVPACFWKLNVQLAKEYDYYFTEEVTLNMTAGPDDPFWESAKEEMARVNSSLRQLKRWALEQRCQPDTCECRADAFLRQLLEEAGGPVETGLSRTRRRPVCLIAGPYSPPGDPERRYLEVHFRRNIAHAVRFHRGWRAVLVTAAGTEPVYISPDYPETPVSSYYEDTQACAAAIVTALDW